MSDVKVMIDHDKEGGYYKIHIRIPDHHVSYAGMKIHLLTWGSGSGALNALDIARRIIEEGSISGSTSLGGNVRPSPNGSSVK